MLLRYKLLVGLTLDWQAHRLAHGMTETSSIDDNPPPLLDIVGAARVLWQRKMLVIGIAAAIVLAAVGYLAVTKPIFTASAVVLVDPRTAQTTDSDNVLSGIGNDSAAIASQVTIIRSRQLLGAIYESEQIATDPEFSDSGLLGNLFGGRPPTQDMIFDRFSANVSVEREGLTYVLTVSFKSFDPQKAARIVNAIVERYVGSQITEKSDANAEVTDLLKSRIGGLQQAVTEAEQAIEAFKVANNIYDSGAGGTVLQSQIDQLNTQLVGAQEVARQTASAYEQAVAAGKSPRALIELAAVLSSPAADKLRDEYNQRSTEYASAQSVFGTRHPTMVKLRAELTRVEALMVKEVERITAAYKSARDLAASNVVKIEDDIAALRGQSNLSSQKAVELRQLERNAEASRQVLEQFQKRSEETSQFQDLQLSDARIIGRATPPAQATWPKSTLLLAVAGALGLVLGCAVALFLGPVPATPQVTNKPASGGLFARKPRAEAAIQAAIPLAPATAGPAQAQSVNLAPPPQPRLRPAPAEPALPILATLRTRYAAPSLLPTRDEIDAAQLEVSTYPQSPFALQIAALISRLLGTLDASKAPYVLSLSSVGDRFETRRLAYSLATGLQRVGAPVVVVDLDPLLPPPAQAHAALRLATSDHHAVQAPITTDPVSGVPTLMEDGAASWDKPKVSRLLAQLSPSYNFIVIIGKPFAHRHYSATLAAIADQELFVLTPEDLQARRGDALAASLPADSLRWKGIVAIDHGSDVPRPRTTSRNPDVRAAVADIQRANRYATLS